MSESELMWVGSHNLVCQCNVLLGNCERTANTYYSVMQNIQQ